MTEPIITEVFKAVWKKITGLINKEKTHIFADLPYSYEDNIGTKFVLQRIKGDKGDSDRIVNRIKVYTWFYNNLQQSQRQKELFFIENENIPKDKKLEHILTIGEQYLPIYNASDKNCEGSVLQFAEKQSKINQKKDEIILLLEKINSVKDERILQNDELLQSALKNLELQKEVIERQEELIAMFRNNASLQDELIRWLKDSLKQFGIDIDNTNGKL